MPRWKILPRLCTNVATLRNPRLPSTIRCISTEEAQLAKKAQKMWMGNEEIISLRGQKNKSTPQNRASNANADLESTSLLPPERRDTGTPEPCFPAQGFHRHRLPRKILRLTPRKVPRYLEAQHLPTKLKI